MALAGSKSSAILGGAPSALERMRMTQAPAAPATPGLVNAGPAIAAPAAPGPLAPFAS